MANQRLLPLNTINPGPAVHRLVILIPAMGSDLAPWTSLVEKLQAEPGYTPAEAHWMWFDHCIKPWTRGDWRPSKDPGRPGPLEVAARQLRNLVRDEWKRDRGYDDVVLIGHSIGGLLARRIYLLAAGAVPDQQPSPWGEHVSRIVLFAAVNRGFRLESLTPLQRGVARLARGLSVRLFYFEDALRGSDFVTNLRVDWIRHFRGMQDREPSRLRAANVGQTGVPLVVQFVGDNDPRVDAEDNKDMLAFPNGNYIEVSGANHGDLFRLDMEATPDPTGRYALLREAFVSDPADMNTESHRPGPSSIQRVVFLLHGIRASNVDDWVTQLKSKLKERGGEQIKVVAPTYGFLSALRFALPWVRKRHIPIVRDDYTEMLAEHPRAEFSIIAHSNGTYMLGHCLKRTAGMRFENIVLAGSALPQNFPWADIMNPNTGGGRQVERVMNERADHDEPIALLCGALRGLRMTDIGTAGFAGFVRAPAAVREVAYHVGSHGAALMETNQNRLIDFVMGGEPADPELVGKPFWFSGFSQASPFVLWLLLVVILALMICISFPGWVFNPWGAGVVLLVIIVVIVGLASL